MSITSNPAEPTQQQPSGTEPHAPRFHVGARVLFHTTHNNGTPCTMAGRISAARPARIGGVDTWLYTFADERTHDIVTAYDHWLAPDLADTSPLLAPTPGVHTPAPRAGRRAKHAT